MSCLYIHNLCADVEFHEKIDNFYAMCKKRQKKCPVLTLILAINFIFFTLIVLGSIKKIAKRLGVKISTWHFFFENF
jgi:hypothetical protein